MRDDDSDLFVGNGSLESIENGFQVYAAEFFHSIGNFAVSVGCDPRINRLCRIGLDEFDEIATNRAHSAVRRLRHAFETFASCK